MNQFSAENYFDLERFEHGDIFMGRENVWEVLGIIREYLRAHGTWGIHGKVHPTAVIENPDEVFIHPDAVVEACAFIKGPCIIGAGSEVRHCAYVRGNVIVGRNCVVGHTTEVKNAIFMDNAKAGHFAYVGDSILGNDVNLGAGTKLANLKVIDSPVTITYDDQIINTGLRKFGAILGDGVETGCNSVTMPGAIIGKSTVCYPNTTLKGVIGERSIVSPERKLRIRERRD
ncbi:MAG: hypothetical protein CVV64_13195 [Candidatus Wallbacteria bacterium HGW-Wallbacteria-1]|jgi:NDP-sugar pyrophosphorylase family protein|uniref:Mannose-1-phosphate guanyltransferase C-terminal domain-containing protein n=1 Tax=Candidatus Wallbacteria bacterium HGW-Wallbacteria-1 TaxID=2013854 RepID=A0A2N1PMR5_9BACT|nr:MAG: hypothetical protein CVV64_13195 [Candidatus Wallbacteria bacterium HGW-Wallbacteria-1]